MHSTSSPSNIEYADAPFSFRVLVSGCTALASMSARATGAPLFAISFAVARRMREAALVMEKRWPVRTAMTAVEMRVEGGHPSSKDATSALFNLLQSSFNNRVQQLQILQDCFTTGRFERQRQDHPSTRGRNQSTSQVRASRPARLHTSAESPHVQKGLRPLFDPMCSSRPCRCHTVDAVLP